MGIFKRDDIVRDLRTAVIEVFFEKVNGQDRVMRCTLRPDLLPATYATDINEEKAYHATNPEIIAAWDIQANGWRSFRVDSIKYVSDVNENY